MAPRSFSEDGASGASGDAIDTATSPGEGSGFGMANESTGATNLGGHWDPSQPQAPSGESSNLTNFRSTGLMGVASRPPAPAVANGPADQGFTGFTNNAFAAGGAIGEEDMGDPNATDPQGSALGNSLQLSINKALSDVQSVLSYGRQLHGLGGDAGGDQGAVKTAGRMPALPGNQSESGRPPVQPMPGPLPPTSNPFGKRATMSDAGSDSQGGDNAAPGAIDTEEEAA